MEIHDIQNMNIIQRNREKSRSYFIPFSSEEDALTYNRGNSERFQLLNGLWSFHYSSNPFEVPTNFYEETFDVSEWDYIQVPHHWQLQGYDKPHYTNTDYPFPIDPPNVPTENPTGLYRREFQVSESWMDKQIVL